MGSPFWNMLKKSSKVGECQKNAFFLAKNALNHNESINFAHFFSYNLVAQVNCEILRGFGLIYLENCGAGTAKRAIGQKYVKKNFQPSVGGGVKFFWISKILLLGNSTWLKVSEKYI